MLSAVIRSELSYGAMPLAGQPPDQRFVQLGPLVTCFTCHQVGRLYLHPSKTESGVGILIQGLSFGF